MYQWDPKDYCKSSPEQEKWARELIEKLSLKGDERVLDIGSGDGRITAILAEKVPRGSVVGIDSSMDMVGFAQECFPGISFSNLRFMACDARSLSFTEEFDVIFSNATLHWIADHLPVLRGMHRSLKPSGRFLIQMGGKGNAGGILHIIGQLIADPPWNEYFVDFSFPYGFHSVEEYREWLNETGFTAKRVELIPKVMVFSEPEGLASWIRTTWLPYTQRVPGPLRQAFIDQVVVKYINHYCAGNDRDICVKMVRLEVEAVK